MEQESKELPNFSIEMNFNTRGRNQQFTDDGVKQLKAVTSSQETDSISLNL